MVKLKCWKRAENRKNRITYYNKEESKNIIIFKDKRWLVDLDDSKIAFKKFKSKFPALKFANKYMKKHDRC